MNCQLEEDKISHVHKEDTQDSITCSYIVS